MEELKMANEIKNISLEGCRLIFRNFSGKEGKFNSEGQRNFGVILPDELALKLANDGWNVKYLQSRDEEEGPTPWIKVKVSYGNIVPNIYLVTKRNKTLLDEETVKSLDYAEIENVDIIIRPYCWNINGKTGITAYVKNMYVTVVEDEFAAKYDFEEEIPF